MAKKATTKKAATKPAAQTTDNLLDALAGVTTTKKKSKAAKAQRAALEVPSEVEEVIAQFVAKKTVFDLVDSAFKPVKDEAKVAVWTEYCKHWHRIGTIPENPRLEVKKDGKLDCEAMFVLSQRFYPQIDLTLQDDETVQELAVRARQGVIDDLRAGGIKGEIAKKFVDEELNFAPEQGCRSFRELSHGHKEGKVWVDPTEVEQSVAAKLIKSLLNQDHEEFTDEERAAALFIEARVTVKPDVLTRVSGRNGYARTPEEIELFCAVVNPVYYVSRAKFAVGDSVSDRNDRLVGVLSDIMGTE